MRESTPAASQEAKEELLDLVSRAKQGDTLAFTGLVLRHQALVVSLIREAIDRPEDVEDIYQETWVRAWHSIGKLRNLEQFRPWLCRIAVNQARNWYRQKKHQTFLVLPDQDEEEEIDMNVEVKLSVASPEETIINQSSMLEAFSHLSHQMKVCVLLADQWGYNLEEIAGILGVSKGTVSSYLCRGRQRFCQVYQRLVGGSNVQQKREEENDQ